MYNGTATLRGFVWQKVSALRDSSVSVLGRTVHFNLPLHPEVVIKNAQTVKVF